jgi:hypothetical protein
MMMTEIQLRAAPRGHYDECSGPDDSNRSSTSVDDSHRSANSYDDEKLIHDLRSTLTLESRNLQQGQSRTDRETTTSTRRRRTSHQRKSGDEDDGGLREKFEIESLHIQISELKRQNEVLREMWESVRRR